MKNRILFTLAFLLAFVMSVSAQKKISDYPNTATAANTDLMIWARPGVTNLNQSYQQLATQLRTNDNWFLSGYTRLVFEGDSITGDYYPPTYASWLTNLYLNKPFFVWGTNAAKSGDTSLDTMNLYTNEIAPFKPASGTNAIVFLWIGINDWQKATDFPLTYVGMTNPVVSEQNISNFCYYARRDGFKVCVLTVSQSSLNTQAANVHQFNLNALLRRGAYWDWLVDVDSMFPPPLNSNYYLDNTHFNTNSTRLIAAAVADTILSNDPRGVRYEPISRGIYTNNQFRASVGSYNTVVLTNGFVGIKKTDPLYSLDIETTPVSGIEGIRVRNPLAGASSTTMLTLENNRGSFSTYLLFEVTSSAYTGGTFGSVADEGILATAGSSAKSLIVGTVNAYPFKVRTSNAEHLRITAAGDMWIPTLASVPGSPDAGFVSIYAVTNGSGKIVVAAKFSDGSTNAFATQP